MMRFFNFSLVMGPLWFTLDRHGLYTGWRGIWQAAWTPTFGLICDGPRELRRPARGAAAWPSEAV